LVFDPGASAIERATYFWGDGKATNPTQPTNGTEVNLTEAGP